MKAGKQVCEERLEDSNQASLVSSNIWKTWANKKIGLNKILCQREKDIY